MNTIEQLVEERLKLQPRPLTKTRDPKLADIVNATVDAAVAAHERQRQRLQIQRNEAVVQARISEERAQRYQESVRTIEEQLARATGGEAERKKNYAEDIERIWQREDVTKLSTADDKLIVHTAWLRTQVLPDGSIRGLGEFDLKINLATNSWHIIRTTPDEAVRIPASWFRQETTLPGQGWPHPHINRDRVCMGNVSDLMHALSTRGDRVGMVYLMLDYLQEINWEDSWGKSVWTWLPDATSEVKTLDGLAWTPIYRKGWCMLRTTPLVPVAERRCPICNQRPARLGAAPDAPACRCAPCRFCGGNTIRCRCYRCPECHLSVHFGTHDVVALQAAYAPGQVCLHPRCEGCHRAEFEPGCECVRCEVCNRVRCTCVSCPRCLIRRSNVAVEGQHLLTYSCGCVGDPYTAVLWSAQEVAETRSPVIEALRILVRLHEVAGLDLTYWTHNRACCYYYTRGGLRWAVPRNRWCPLCWRMEDYVTGHNMTAPSRALAPWATLTMTSVSGWVDRITGEITRLQANISPEHRAELEAALSLLRGRFPSGWSDARPGPAGLPGPPPAERLYMPRVQFEWVERNAGLTYEPIPVTIPATHNVRFTTATATGAAFNIAAYPADTPAEEVDDTDYDNDDEDEDEDDELDP